MTAQSSLFPTTRWTRLLNAKDSKQAREEALRSLMQIYWRPLFVYLRRSGLTTEAAEDAVQGIWLQLIERDAIDSLTPERGHLRAYLKTVATNYLRSQHEAKTAAKRGGSQVVELSLEIAHAENLAADAEQSSPELAFEKAWADSVMQTALQQLKAEFESGARAGPFELVTRFFSGQTTQSYREAAAEFKMSLPQLKAFLHRARVRYQELVQAAVQDTVATEAAIADEVKAVTGVSL